MLKVIREANKIIKPRVNAKMLVEESSTGYNYTFEFEHFTLNVTVGDKEEDGREWIDSRIARYVLNNLEWQISCIYLDNTNFCDGFGNYKPGKFDKSPA